MVAIDEMATEESYITIILIVHDDVNGEPRVEVSLQKSKLGPSWTKSLVTSSKEQQQQ